MGDAPDTEQQVAIATYFMMSSPTGELDEVVTDVKKLATPGMLTDDIVGAVLRDYNIERMTFGPDPSGSACLVSAHGKVADDLFLDPATSRVMRFNHSTRKFVEVTDKKQVLSGAVAGFRTALETQVKDYMSKNYKKGKAAFAVYGADDGRLTVCISASNVNLGNFWTGGWRASYQIDTSSSGPQTLKGEVKLNVHYFEDGNVQLHTDFPSSTKVTVGDAKSTAEAVVKAIRASESKFQSSLEELYVEMHDHTFKKMRRFWPINKQPFDWNTAAHRMTEQLHAGQ